MPENDEPASPSAQTLTLLARSRFRGSSVAWDDIIGHEPAKRELSVVAAQVRRQSVAQQLGLTLVSGVLISGPPGTGKTMLAKALAGAIDRPVYVLPSAEANPVLIRELYEALALEACVVVWDEADAFLRSRREFMRRGNNDEAKTVAAFCTALDGVNPIAGPITVALTAEHEAMLDDSALRAGRLTTHVELELPNRDERRVMWNSVVGRLPTAGPLDLERATDRSVGMSGADIAATVMVALGLSLVDGTDSLRQELLDEAILRRNRVDERPPRSSLNLWRSAVHEAGHALFAATIWGPQVVASITVTRSGPEDGRTQLSDEFLEGIDLDFGLIRQQAAWNLAGLAAEELVFGTDATSPGSSGDIARASRHLHGLVADLGASPAIGPLDVSVLEYGGDSDRGSDFMRTTVWQEVRAGAIVALAEATTTLGGRVAQIRQLADRLIAAQDLTLSGRELELLLTETLGAENRAPDAGRSLSLGAQR